MLIINNLQNVKFYYDVAISLTLGYLFVWECYFLGFILIFDCFNVPLQLYFIYL